MMQHLAAAAILLGVVFVIGKDQLFKRTTVPGDAVQVKKAVDVSAPQSSLAYILLDDGSKLYLDTLQNNGPVSQGFSGIRKINNQEIAYSGAGKAAIFNTIVNPKGSKLVKLTLSDGTRVWLNAGSSLRYPVTFSGNARNVEMKGEGYFEVSHRNNQPFHVNTGKVFVEVLGTSFNIKAHGNNMAPEVSLIKGSISVTNEHENAILHPGQQAIVHNHLEVVTISNMLAITAWKDERFVYEGTDLKSIMDEVSRWYDLNIEYNVQTNDRFYFEVSRNSNVSTVINILKNMTGLNFTLTNRTLRITK